MATDNNGASPRLLWTHPNPQQTRMYQFMQRANRECQLQLNSFDDLYKFSVDDATRTHFWRLFWDEAAIIHEGSFTQVVDVNARMDSIPKWYEGTQMNYAENVLFERDGMNGRPIVGEAKADRRIAISEVREGCRSEEIRELNWKELRNRVRLLSNAMRARGVRKGDRVAVVASNSIDTLVTFLSITALGGLFSSSSTDMGLKGILDRLLQIRPKWVFIDDWAFYNGKKTDLRSKIADVVDGLKDVAEFEGVVTQPRYDEPADVSAVPRTMQLQEFLKTGNPQAKLKFERVAFSDPLLVCYSSGTTGPPKCIVHSVGGIMISVMKEGKLHRDHGPDTVQLQYTTTGWIMYLSAVNCLISGARSVLYDGSPFHPDITAFVKLIGDQKVTNLGISPRYLHELQKNKIAPRDITNLSSLKGVTSTGMVLKEQLFEWFYDVGFPKHVQLANISGGTDIAGCFAMENPLTPVYVGGCQGPSLGTAVEVFDQQVEGGEGIKGTPVEKGVPGELVATKSFPNMPVFFWGADGAEKYHKAYFSRFDNVWTHGDFIQINPETNQYLFLGRADGVLNPSGVRFGSAEIYNVLESFFPQQINDSLCVGQRRPQDDDESVMLFILMSEGEKFTERLVNDVKAAIGRELSKRHVPKYIFETKAIPTTVNGKKVELPVKQIVSGVRVKPSGTLLNPECLEWYYQFQKPEDVMAGQMVKAKL